MFLPVDVNLKKRRKILGNGRGKDNKGGAQAGTPWNSSHGYSRYRVRSSEMPHGGSGHIDSPEILGEEPVPDGLIRYNEHELGGLR